MSTIICKSFNLFYQLIRKKQRNWPSKLVFFCCPTKVVQRNQGKHKLNKIKNANIKITSSNLYSSPSWNTLYMMRNIEHTRIHPNPHFLVSLDVTYSSSSKILLGDEDKWKWTMQAIIIMDTKASGMRNVVLRKQTRSVITIVTSIDWLVMNTTNGVKNGRISCKKKDWEGIAKTKARRVRNGIRGDGPFAIFCSKFGGNIYLP